MIIIIPIGGTGQRFKENGYKKPKALINIYGKPIISYLLDNLCINAIDYVLIPYNKEYKKYRFEDFLRQKYPKINFRFFCIENDTRGAAETINIGIENSKEERDIPVLCLDSDNFYTCDIISQWNGENCIFSFEDTQENPIYSYVQTNENDVIVDMKEKVKISNNACTGAYGFRSINELKSYTSKIIRENITQKSEFYTSGVIREMIKEAHTFKNKTILQSNFICLGTPLQLKNFYSNYPHMNISFNEKTIVTNKRICFDLDNTLVTFPTINGDYTSVRPIEKNIKLLRFLKRKGNTIIIYTARRMRTHGGNIGKINADIGRITFETLERFNIPYDEIYFGKPYADFYIDDLALSCFDDLEKELGYYDNKIKPRDFHSIQVGNIDTIIKSGDLRGENYYYQNIPPNLKDLFPTYISGNNRNITIEKINGLTITELYLSQILDESTFIYILNCVKRIQDTNITIDDDINLYENYALKLENRYENFDYSPYENSESVYRSILKQLQDYEKNNLGVKKMIHGDPVFTNIIADNYGKIKFIDMRGKVGNKLTITGDWLYDWAKIYQSLIGYDEILLSRAVETEYKHKMIDVFKKYFLNQYSQQDFENLKMITKSLIFSLIPLHNNDKCTRYYNLLFSNYL